MDSDTKEFRHVRVADRRTAWGDQESDDTFQATVLPIENLPLARVLTRFAIDPYKSTIEQAAVENK
jgi:hypothetical protein